MHEIEVWVLVDEEGNAVSSCDADLLADLYDSQVEGGAGMSRRVVRVVVKVRVDSYVSVFGTVPDEEPAELSL